MVLKKLYVLARGISDRPTCQHLLVDGTSSVTACGANIENWSREYTPKPFETILCRKAACRL